MRFIEKQHNGKWGVWDNETNGWIIPPMGPITEQLAGQLAQGYESAVSKDTEIIINLRTASQ